ncbi:MAG: hypothetical protein AAF449_11110 [Myxococcota bacterium]
MMLPKVPLWRHGSKPTEAPAEHAPEAETVEMAMRMLQACQQPLLAVHLARKLVQFGMMIAPERLDELLRLRARHHGGLRQDDLERWRLSSSAKTR